MKSIVGTVGERIRQRRKAIGMTQADLAAAIGVSFQQVQKYEKGISAVSGIRLQQICDVMKLPPQFFTDVVGSAEGRAAGGDTFGHAADCQSVTQFLDSGEGKRLIEAFMSIRDQKLRTRILDFIAAVSNDRPL